MRALRIVGFVKTRACPPSEALLLYSKRTLAGRRLEAINTHLSACDFCGAETQLLTKFPPPTPPASFGFCEMPAALRSLAEELILERSLLRLRIFETSHEFHRLTLTDA
jgi:hypothetical protein